MPGSVTASFLHKLETRREDERATAERLLLNAKNNRRDQLTDDEEIQMRVHQQTLRDLDERIAETRAELARCGSFLAASGGSDAMSYARVWAQRVAEKLHRSMGGGDGMERRVVVSGSLDIPQFIEPQVIPMARPQRLIDLFTNRLALDGNAFEFFVQTARTNTATAVADNALKPTSTLTVAPKQDRCRVIAHLSEATPLRLWYDHDEFVSWLTNEMVAGVLDGLEAQIVSGDGTGENMLGLLATPGLTTVAFATDPITTLRSALTALQVKGETPTGWALHPADAQAIDLTRWSTAGGFLSGGYENDTGNGFGTSDNIFGVGLKRVVTPSVPVGTAILGDFSKLRVYVRQDAHIDVDASGVLFTKNQFIARGEGRFGIGVLRPSAFAVCDLTA
ncbi:MAG: phage major capsid protein [Mycobacteriaceae bacterium]|nr:phage major capsid protein [Mycobacteriaceae bacterium]